MYRIDNATAATSIPTPGGVGPNPNGFFTVGSPGVTPATVVDADWANAVQEEICNTVTGAGISLSKTVRTQLLQAITNIALGAGHGQCYFSYSSSTQVKLSPRNGNRIIVNGVQCQIPGAGITAANTGVYVNGVAAQNLAASTAYYAALANISGTLTLGFFALASYGHAPDTTAGNAGVEVITSSGTPQSAWTLVGMVATSGSGQFQQSSGVIGAISWFNRTNLLASDGASSVTGTSTAGAELSTQPRVYFCTWSGEVVLAQGVGEASNSIAGDGVGTYIGFNVTTGAPSNSTNIPSIGGVAVPQGALISSSTLPEGVNFATLLGEVSGGTGTFTFTFDVIVRG